MIIIVFFYKCQWAFLEVIHLETKAKKQTNKFLKMFSNEMQILKYKASFSWSPQMFYLLSGPECLQCLNCLRPKVTTVWLANITKKWLCVLSYLSTSSMQTAWGSWQYKQLVIRHLQSLVRCASRSFLLIIAWQFWWVQRTTWNSQEFKWFCKKVQKTQPCFYQENGVFKNAPSKSWPNNPSFLPLVAWIALSSIPVVHLL